MSTKKSRWDFWTSWMLITGVSWGIASACAIIGILLMAILLSIIPLTSPQSAILVDRLPWVLWIATLSGETIGFFQYNILRDYISRSAWWIVVTNLGWIIGMSVGFLILQTLAEPGELNFPSIQLATLINMNTSQAFESFPFAEVITNVRKQWYVGAIVGGIIGLTQCLFWRRYTTDWRKLGGWIVVKGVSGVVIVLAISYFNLEGLFWYVGFIDGILSGTALAVGWPDILNLKGT